MTFADKVFFRAAMVIIIGIGWGTVLASALMSPS